MKRQTFLFCILLISVVIAVLHFAALEFYLYWVFPWFDVLMHFLGGLLVALIGIWSLIYVVRTRVWICFSHRNILYTAVGTAIVVGVGWEIFEYINGLRVEHNYALDTITDLIMDLCGAVFAYWVVLRMHLCSTIQ